MASDLPVSSLTAFTSLSPSDVVLGVDVSDHSTPPAGAGGSDKKLPVSILDDRYTDAVVPSADTTGATDAPLLQAALTAGNLKLVPGAQYYSNVPLTMPSNCYVQGNSGTISVGSGFSGTTGLLVLASGSVQSTTVRDLVLSDNYTINNLDGVHFVTANSVPNNYLSHVTTRNFKGNGFKVSASSNSASAHLNGCIAYGNLGDGFAVSSDDVLVNCEAGFNMGHGFHALNGASNCYFSNCLGWFNGVDPRNNTWAGSGTSCGFFADLNSQYVTFNGCSAQQNGLHGFAVGATSGTSGFAFECNVTGCSADTNSSYANNVGHGIFASAPFACAFTGNTGGNNNALSPGSQAWGLQIAGAATSSRLTGNTITGTSGNVDFSTASGYRAAAILGLVATTGTAGTALINGTGNILSWTAPNDGQLHRITALGTYHVTSALTGGQCQVKGTTPDGTAVVNNFLNGNEGISSGGLGPFALVVQANTTVTVTQVSAASAGTATVWAEIWAS